MIPWTTSKRRRFPFSLILMLAILPLACDGSGGGADTTPPGDVTSFTATTETGRIVLSWSNPADGDFAGVLIRRDTAGFPASSTEGTEVYDDTGSGHTDTAATGTVYYYTAFAHDAVPNYSEGVNLSASFPSGILDTTFGAPDGFVVHDNAAGGSSRDSGNAITTDAAGNILVAGFSDNGANDDMVIWRYTAAGALDTTFGGAGFVVHHNAAGGSGDDSGDAITTDAAGNILVAGTSIGSGFFDMAIWRYTAAGVLDTTFGGDVNADGIPDGFVVHDNAAGGSGSDFGRAITTDGSGNILVAGSSTNGSGNDDLVIWRYR